MLINNCLTVSKHIFIILMMSIFLIACDNNPEDSNAIELEEPVPTLSDENINDFIVKMAKDYNVHLASLMAAFNQAKKNGEIRQFINFRNYQWTPLYIKQKNYYQKVWAQNLSYLSTSPNKPLFDSFEYLIYTGINLKNGLLDKDDAKLQALLVEIQKDSDIVNSFIN